jgi:hypothetical protein
MRELRTLRIQPISKETFVERIENKGFSLVVKVRSE